MPGKILFENSKVFEALDTDIGKEKSTTVESGLSSFHLAKWRLYQWCPGSAFKNNVGWHCHIRSLCKRKLVWWCISQRETKLACIVMQRITLLLPSKN